jgi:glycosyltransferase involved in cell wall biosynthesis
MKLLIFTQKLDKNDRTLGFFAEWVKHLSVSFEKISVVCLEKGDFDLPENVSVYSIGKEEGMGKLLYVVCFYKYLFDLRGKYDAVFVHMNEEYILLGGLFWKLARRPVFFWRNHSKGSAKTRLAVFLSKKVFCTAKDSFTAKFKKTILMPVGVDTDLFREDKNIFRNKNSVCMVGRIAPVKKIELCLQAVLILIGRGVQVSLTVLGPCDKKNLNYFNFLKNFVLKNNLSPYVGFFDGVPPAELPKIYNSREISVNLTASGSFDKTIVEAAACGAAPLVSNKSLSGLLPDLCLTENDAEILARSIQTLLRSETRLKIENDLKNFAERNSLKNLTEKLVKEIKS